MILNDGSQRLDRQPRWLVNQRLHTPSHDLQLLRWTQPSCRGVCCHPSADVSCAVHLGHSSSLRSRGSSAGSCAPPPPTTPLYSVKSRANIKSRWATIFCTQNTENNVHSASHVRRSFALHFSPLHGGAVQDSESRIRYCELHVLTFRHGLDRPPTWKRRLDFWSDLSITSTANT